MNRSYDGQELAETILRAVGTIAFPGWTHADREAAMKILATLHRHLPADPKAKPLSKPDKPATNGQPGSQLLDGQTESGAI